jgi:hypothetical protein
LGEAVRGLGLYAKSGKSIGAFVVLGKIFLPGFLPQKVEHAGERYSARDFSIF